MTRRQTLLLTGLIVTLSTGAALMWPTATPAEPTEATSTPRAWAMAWQPDTLYRYRLDYASRQEVSPFAGSGVDDGQASMSFTSRVAYVGEVAWRLIGEGPDGSWRLGLRLANCEVLTVRVSDQDLLPEDDGCSVLVDPRDEAPWELVVQVDRRGRVMRVEEPTAAPEVFGVVAAYFASELAVTWPTAADTTWRVSEVDMLGTVASHYTILDDDDAILDDDDTLAAVERRRSRYHELDAAGLMKTAWVADANGRHKIQLHNAGYLRSLKGAQTVSATDAAVQRFLKSTSRLQLELIGLEPITAPAPAPATTTARAIKQPRAGGDAQRRLLASRTRGLTAEDALSTLTRFANGGKLPDHNRFLWRMTGLLRLHPELAASLIPIFKEGNTSARRLVLDLLASAGTSEAQAAMRELIASQETATDPRRHELAQRLGLLDAPDEATVDFARDRFEQSTGSDVRDDHYSAAYTLGAVARHTDVETGAELRGQLVRELSSATDPAEVGHFIKALGNARATDDGALLASYAAHAHSDVRLATAHVLGRPPTDDGLAALLQLVTDPDRGVQKEAIRSLRHHALTDEHFAALTEVVNAGLLHHTNQRAILELTKLFRARLPEATGAFLEALVAAGIKDNRVAAAAHQLMSWGPG